VLSTADAAGIIGVAARTVQDWAQRGLLPVTTERLGPRKIVYRIDAAALGAWMRDVRPTMRRVGRPRKQGSSADAE